MRPLCDHAKILHADRRAAFRGDDRVPDVLNVLDQADLAHIDLLLAFLDEAAASIGVVIGELLFDLADAQPVVDELVGIEANLVLARRPAEGIDVHNAGNRLEILLDHPGFERLEIHHVVLGVGAAQRVEINLADRAPVRAHLRNDAGRARTPAKAAPERARGFRSRSYPRRRPSPRSRARRWTTSGHGRLPECRSSRFRCGIVTCCSICSAEMPGHCAMTST